MTSSQDNPDRVLVNHWLQGIGAKTGLALALDDHGVCAVGHASGIDCALEIPDGEARVYMRAPLMPWRMGEHPLVAEACLAEHFMGMRTSGASFAIDTEEGELVLWKSWALVALDEDRFGQLVVGFLETAAAWRAELEEICRKDPVLTVPSPGGQVFEPVAGRA